MIISYESLMAGGTGKARRHPGAPDGSVSAAVVVVATATAMATPIVDDTEPAAHILVLVGLVVDDRVGPASEKLPAGTAGPRGVAIVSTLPGGYFEVPCYDETVAATCVENTFWRIWRRATDELRGSVTSVECVSCWG
jgi:hypothetical protein